MASLCTYTFLNSLDNVSRSLPYRLRENLSCWLVDVCEYCMIEMFNIQSLDVLMVSVYRPFDLFNCKFSKFLQEILKYNNSKIKPILAADPSSGFLKVASDAKINHFVNYMQHLNRLQKYDKLITNYGFS